MTRILSHFFLLGLLTFLVGCGDLRKGKVVKQEIDSSQFEVNCKLDVDEFAKFHKKTIPSQIRCLGENLNLFIRVVETDKPGYMSRAALESYIKNDRPDVKPEVLNALKAVYDLNYLLTGETRDYISKKNVDSLIKIAILINSEMALSIYPFFTSDKDLKYSAHEAQRRWVSVSVKKIISEFRKIFKPKSRSPRELDMVKLLNSFSKTFSDDDLKTITRALFVKKILFGGKTTTITNTELNERVLLQVDPILQAIFDIVKFKKIENFSLQQIVDLLQKNLKSLSEIVLDKTLGNRDNEELFDIVEAVELVEVVMESKKFKAKDWLPLVEIAKKVYMGGHETIVRGADFKNLLAHANDLLKTGSSFYNIWQRFVPAMESPQRVTVNFGEYSHVYPGEAKELADFERIAKNYRFFRGKFESAYYTNGIKRNPDAMVEIYAYEYIIKKVIQTYGTPSPGSLGGYGINRDQLYGVLEKIQDVLVELDLILPHRAANIADNISLLGTLFQYQSDKNGLLDANEATEFALTLLTAMDMSKTLMAYYKKQGCKFDNFQRVEPACFKQNFYKSLCEEFDDGDQKGYRDGYKSFYPLLFESIGVRSCDDIAVDENNSSLLDVSINAARLCNYYENEDGSQGEEVYFSDGDIFTTLVVFMHAETTILRWDDKNNLGNGNNVMDPTEVERAYSIYSPALDGFLLDKPVFIKALKKQIYQFLIKEETVPDETDLKSIKKFAGFLLTPNKSAPAYRRSLAAVLYEIGKQTAMMSEAAGGAKFQCNWLKKPNEIPRVLPPAPPAGPPAPKKTFWDYLKELF